MKTASEYSSVKILIVEDQFITANHLNLILSEKGYQIIGCARSVEQALQIIDKNNPDLVILDIFLDGNETGIELSSTLQKKHIGYIYLSANSDQKVLDLAKQTQPYGFIVKPFKEEDILTTLEIAFYRHQYSIESKFFQIESIERSVKKIIRKNYSRTNAFIEFGKAIQPYIPFCIIELRESSDVLGISVIRKKLDIYQEIDKIKLAQLKKNTATESGLNSRAVATVDEDIVYEEKSYWEFCKISSDQKMFADSFGIRSFIVKTIIATESKTVQLVLHSRLANIYRTEHLALLKGLHPIFVLFTDYFLQSINPPLQQKPIKDDQTFNDEVFNGFIGQSHKMLTVFDYVRKVARTDISVLILGESGTGKEKIADLIHKLSKRADKPLIIINCGAIPDNLAESVLFGHEKGSFTGAFEKRIGKFEQAQGGTIFLDEIAEMPLDMQVKLLRVLQEHEIEPVGGKTPIKLDVRVIAATNKNLEEEIASGKFRMDLYYRLHVFPIELPSLKQRKEDILPLANYFVKSYCEKINYKIPVIKETAQNDLISYDWPGNIRELEHVMYRNVLLNEGDQISNIIFSNVTKSDSKEDQYEYKVKSFDDNERDFILAMLKRCNGKVAGAGGAAELIGIPTSTLTSKMKKLGIVSSNRY